MFDKTRFSEVLKKARGTRSNEEYHQDSGVSRSYISNFINAVKDTPPTPDIIKRLALASKNNVTYQELMEAAGHFSVYDDDFTTEGDDKSVQYFWNVFKDESQINPEFCKDYLEALKLYGDNRDMKKAFKRILYDFENDELVVEFNNSNSYKIKLAKDHFNQFGELFGEEAVIKYCNKHGLKNPFEDKDNLKIIGLSKLSQNEFKELVDFFSNASTSEYLKVSKEAFEAGITADLLLNYVRSIKKILENKGE